MNPDDDNREIERIRQGITEVWKIWMTWFCFFWTLNGVVFWTQPDRGWKWWEAVVWVILNGTGTIAAICLADYCREVKRRSAELLGGRHLGFPSGFAIVGAAFNALALALNTCVWAVALVRRQ